MRDVRRKLGRSGGYGSRMAYSIESRTIVVDEVDFTYLACGDEGPLALCLHGFPDSAHTWRHLLPLLHKTKS